MGLRWVPIREEKFGRLACGGTERERNIEKSLVGWLVAKEREIERKREMDEE